MMVSVDQLACRVSEVTNFSSLEEVMKGMLPCSFWTVTTELIATSHSTLSCSDNFGSSVPAGNIIIYDANGNADVLTNFS
jgi:penicillin V acylase-like amidase (Ntn superfamily)